MARLSVLAAIRWVCLLPRRTKRLAWNHWVISLIILGAATCYGFYRYWRYESTADAEAALKKSAADAQQLTNNRNFAVANRDNWVKAFLGDRQSICFESYDGSNLSYNVVCHIGVKGQNPTSVLQCTQAVCELKAP